MRDTARLDEYTLLAYHSEFITIWTASSRTDNHDTCSSAGAPSRLLRMEHFFTLTLVKVFAENCQGNQVRAAHEARSLYS